MPNAKVLSEKKAVVDALTERLKGSAAGVLVNYSGISVADDTALRRKLREAGVEYTVVKNTLLRFAINNVGYEALDGKLSGTTSIATSAEDPVAPARILKEYADKLPKFELKGGFMDGEIMSVEEVEN